MKQSEIYQGLNSSSKLDRFEQNTSVSRPQEDTLAIPLNYDSSSNRIRIYPYTVTGTGNREPR